jgi:alpha/beta superfamily hydrolase
MSDVTINGAEGRLEGKFLPAGSDRAPVALLLHPHPQHGGTMHNKVVYTLNQAFARAGFSTLRFNFRGVGRSQGSYGRGEGELQDAASALDWIQQNHPNSRGCWIAGFSFGAWIGMQLLMRRPEIDRFIAVAPPANIFDFAFLAPCPSSGLILQGDKDEIVPEESVAKLAEKLSKQKDIVVDFKVVKGANHFFADRLDRLDAHVADYAAVGLATMRAATPPPPVAALPPPPPPERKPPTISLPPDAPSRAEAKKAAKVKTKPAAKAKKPPAKKAKR